LSPHPDHRAASVPAAAVGLRKVWQRLRRNPPAMVALAFLVLLLLVAVFGDVITQRGPNESTSQRFAGASGEYWLGTDDLGRDVFSRLVAGTRVSLRSSFQVVAVALLLALPLGLVAGYFKGVVDTLIMRAMDALMSVPALVLALAVAGVLGRGLGNMLIALSIVITPGLVRLTRAQTLSIREEIFVEASRTIGTSTPRILITRILPNAAPPIVVAASLYMGVVIIAEAALSFLGLGQAPPAASWGSMLRAGFDFILVEPWQMVPPGLAIACTVLAFNTVGDGLLDAMGADRSVRRSGIAHQPGLTDAITRSVTASSTTPAASPASELEPLLRVRDLTVDFVTEGRRVTVADKVSFDVRRGEVLALVGESGSGKTVTTQAIMRLIPSPPGQITDGSVEFEGRHLLQLSFAEMRRLRGKSIALVPQDPMASLNPAFTIGDQVIEAIRIHERVSRGEASRRASDLLASVGIPDPVRRLGDYPHQFSGGMRQRAMIAMALACDPVLLIADEPTTALDVTVQAQIIELLRSLRDERQMAMIFVTHNLGVVADLADRVAVMYAGQIVEQASVDELFEAPSHPYTERLLAATPQRTCRGDRLVAITGRVPSLDQLPGGCRFHPRCDHAVDSCRRHEPDLELSSRGSQVRCIRQHELQLQGGQ
jgi:peptide/nickel transport system permease protein